MSKNAIHTDIIRCCEDRFNRGSATEWKHSDFFDLNGEIFQNTGINISPKTLKRIFGKGAVDDSYIPRQATIDALSKYGRYSPAAFQAQPEETPAQPEELPAQPEELPVQPEETPAQPEELPAQPEETPAQPEEAPVQPDETPVQPDETPAEPEEIEQPVADRQASRLNPSKWLSVFVAAVIAFCGILFIKKLFGLISRLTGRSSCKN